MNPKIKVKFENVSKQFNLYKKQSDKLVDLFINKKNKKSFYAVKNVSFEVYEGETIGIIGTNGSGKSTLSNLLAQVVPPSSGLIEINGETSLIAISAGLNANITGLENIELKCLMLGLKKGEIKEITPKIIEFADIGDFINQPVKNYSSGMKSRLGFAISVHTNPDILIVDEALSVGDQTFTERCVNKINEFKKSGKTIFFISHSLSQIRTICDRVIWLNYGQIERIGEAKFVVARYKGFIDKFNKFSNNQKKAYREKKLAEQYSPLSNNYNGEAELPGRQMKKRLVNIKNNKKSRFFFTIQFSLLSFLVLVSFSFMLLGNPINILQSGVFSNEDKSSSINEVSTGLKDTNPEIIRKYGIVISATSTLYNNTNLSDEKAELSFGTPVFIEEKLNGVFKVRTNYETGYISVDDIDQKENISEDNDLNISQFVDLFPDQVKNSYEYFLAQFDQDYSEVKSKLRGLTDEKSDDFGLKYLSYNSENITIVFNNEDIADEIIIENILIDEDGFNEYSSLAQLKSKDDRLLFFKLDSYELILDRQNSTLTIFK